MLPISHMRHPLGVRKGAWTEEEDLLLKKCVEKYGEGNWRQIPLRAGLNRCRKSCRLRWLNYLHPKIKRGEFAVDEIDLIIRMHNLLGNRWSLIAGRLPGRTANDIKNYWNTHVNKRLPPRSKDSNNYSKDIKFETAPPKIKALKPQPRTFSKKFQTLKNNLYIPRSTIQSGGETSDELTPAETFIHVEDHIQSWWENIQSDKDNNGRNYANEVFRSFGIDGIETKLDEGNVNTSSQEGGAKNDWDDLCLDMVDLWE